MEFVSQLRPTDVASGEMIVQAYFTQTPSFMQLYVLNVDERQAHLFNTATIQSNPNICFFNLYQAGSSRLVLHVEDRLVNITH